MTYKVYLAGPMTNVGGNYNFPLFDHVATKLRKAGCEVFSPPDHARKCIGPDEKIFSMPKDEVAKYVRSMFKQELDWICDHANVILLLPGWQQSIGARAEHAVALACRNIKVVEADTILLIDEDSAFNIGSLALDLAEKMAPDGHANRPA